jgi:hypothetical protein
MNGVPGVVQRGVVRALEPDMLNVDQGCMRTEPEHGGLAICFVNFVRKLQGDPQDRPGARPCDPVLLHPQ